MKKVILSALIIIILLGGCKSSDNGELTGVAGRKNFFEPEPFRNGFHTLPVVLQWDQVIRMLSSHRTASPKSLLLRHSGWTRRK